MGFDDLARHMASRDGTKAKPGPITADAFLAEAAESDRRLSRKRDLILGPILLVGGLVVLAFLALYLLDAFDPTPHPERPPGEDTVLVPIGATVFVGGMVITGLLQTIRGLRGRSH